MEEEFNIYIHVGFNFNTGIRPLSENEKYLKSRECEMVLEVFEK